LATIEAKAPARSRRPRTGVTENERRVLHRDPNPHLFRPLTLRSVTLPNRIMMSPMCQYSATDGVADDWHFVHLGSRAAGGTGLVFTEAAHVEARGRITPSCLGIWSDQQSDALGRIARFIEARGAVPGIQLAHAGRKGSIARPWERSRPLAATDGGWDVVGPSPIPFADGHPVPLEMHAADIERVVSAFASAARRARQAGFRVLEVHAAHGYLIHQFLSPLSNHRQDRYGGDRIGRARFLMEVLEGVRSEWPPSQPLFVRLSCTDWVEGGWDLHDTLMLARAIEARGDVDAIDCSSGGSDPRQKIPTHPGYQVPFAAAVRRETGVPTVAVGLIHTADMAEQILGNTQADVVALGRSLLDDPYWPLHAARQLRARAPWPVQYERGDIF
jgi:2,4-dienoyl-CoA reductase-like NADH-dependent reductase (Old Yellow Enzyme family)